MRVTAACTALLLALTPDAANCEQSSSEIAAGDLRRKACAAYDLHVLSLIEEHGDRGEVSGAALTDAAAALIRARTLCRNARIADGLATYDSIALPAPAREFLR
jgi:hypothetical protein